MRRWLPAVMILVLLLDGCVSTHKVVKTDLTLSLDEVLRRVNDRNTKVHTLQGDGSITVESPEGSHSGSFDAYLKKPDSLRVELNGPFGIHVGTLMLSRERFLFYNRLENTAIVGKPDGATLQSMFRLKMQFDEVLRAFTGEFPAAGQEDSLQLFSVREDQYVITYRTKGGAKEYRIDGNAFVVSAYREFDTSGTVTLIATAARVETDEKILIAMPMLLRVIFPQERRSITVAYDGVRFNEPVECSFTIPKQAEIIYR